MGAACELLSRLPQQWKFCAVRQRACFASSETRLPAMDVVDLVAAAELMDVSDKDVDGMAVGGPDGDVERCAAKQPAVDVSSVDKENEEVRQRMNHPRDPGIQPTLISRVRICGGQANDNHLNSAVAAAACEEAMRPMCHLTEDSVRQRATELFGDGTGVPAGPPAQPPVMESASNELCMLALHVSHVPWLWCCPLPAVRALCEPPAAGVCVWGVAPVATPPGGDGGAFGRRLGGAQPPPSLELEPHMRHLACVSVCCSRLPSVCSQACLRASQRPPAAAARRPVCPALPLPPRTPPPPSPPALSAARGHSREACGGPR